MSNIFAYADIALHKSSCVELLALTHKTQQLATTGKLNFESLNPVRSIEDVRFPERPVLLPPRDMPKRKLSTPAGLAAFFHAIAHVEFVAIYLAWDILYRFRGMPEEFYRDWLQVADEEAQHFELLRSKLQTFNVDYGDLPAHSGLWDLAQYTASDLLIRLALIPRNMEAHGLDVTPPLIEKFKQLGDENAVAILTRILNDEVGHVALGSKWFKRLCNQQNFDHESKYQQLLLDYHAKKGGTLKGDFNRALRLAAGFSETEIDWLATHNHKKSHF